MSQREADARLVSHGQNVPFQVEPPSRASTLLGQLTNLPTALLLGSSTLSALMRDFLDSSTILSVIGLNAAIGYWVERSSEELLASWRKVEAGDAQVLRGGHLRRIAATALVPGDILLCRSGDVIPADARVIDAHRLRCNESTLTGETESQLKTTAPVAPASALADRQSMLYAGTMVASGHGRAVVVATGAALEIAQVHRLLETGQSPTTPLQRRLNQLTNRSATAGVAAALLNGAVGVARGRPLGDVVRGVVALAVAAIPEGLPVVSTAALVRAMQRMRRRGMIVRRLAAAETLGAVTVICADKTGTLTENAMRLELLDVGGRQIAANEVRARADVFGDPATLALTAGVLNSDVDVHGHGLKKEIAGSSTERALITAATAAGLSRTKLRALYPRRELRERSDGISYVVSVHDAPRGGRIAFVKGAPEQVLALCSHDARRPLTARQRTRLLARSEALAADGLRVFALAWKRMRRGADANLAGGYRWIGLAGLRDPLREGAAATVRAAAAAGIRTVILTGDHRRTAESIARAVGLKGEVLEAAQAMRLLTRRGRSDRVCQAAAIARIAPAEKVAIVRALRARGEVVAMAGDGINDAPALKAADIGIAVGGGASDLTRHAADVVLENEDLRSILAAVNEGRIVHDSLRRAIHYQLATNLSEIATILSGTLIGGRDALTPLQLLWINLLTDTFPALALALEPGGDDTLNRRPIAPDAPLLSSAQQRDLVREGGLMAAIGTGAWLVGGQATLFSTIAGMQLGYAARSRAPNIAPTLRFSTLLATAAGLHLLAVAAPPLRVLLGFRGVLSLSELAGFGAGAALGGMIKTNGSNDGIIIRRGNASNRSTVRGGTTR